jgi:hypothetical protein
MEITKEKAAEIRAEVHAAKAEVEAMRAMKTEPRTNRESWFDMLPRERDVMIEKLLYGRHCARDYSPKGARKFTSYIDAAMMLLDRSPHVALLKTESGWQVRTVTYQRDNTATDWYPNLPEAICIFALRAAGIEVENDGTKTAPNFSHASDHS